MKIYTEINYKWLDGQLVKTDSKSFEYDGEASLCMAGVAAGLGQAASGVAATATGTAQAGAQGIQQQVSTVGEGIDAGITGATEVLDAGLTETSAGLEAATNPLDMGGDVLSDVVDATATTVVDPITNATDQITSATTEGLSTGLTAGTEEAGRWGNTLTKNSIALGGTTKHLLDKFQDTVGGGLDGLATTLNDGLAVLTGGGGGGQNKVDVEKMSRKGRIKNKSASKLAVNKSKGRARKSLRIG